MPSSVPSYIPPHDVPVYFPGAFKNLRGGSVEGYTVSYFRGHLKLI